MRLLALSLICFLMSSGSWAQDAGNGSGGCVLLTCDGSVVQLDADLDPNGFGIGMSTLPLGDGSSATFDLDIDLSGTDFSLDFDATEACFAMGGTDVMCWLNDGSDSSVTITGDDTQSSNIFSVETSVGSGWHVDSTATKWVAASGGCLQDLSSGRLYLAGNTCGANATEKWLVGVANGVGLLRTGTSGANLGIYIGGANDPAYSFIGDLDTGMGNPADDTLELKAGGVAMVSAVEAAVDVVTITDVLGITCISTAPATGSKGQIYCDSDLTVPCWYNGTGWVQMDDFTTACS